MSAMDSSSRNAGDMLDRLTLTYNRSLSVDHAKVSHYDFTICFVLVKGQHLHLIKLDQLRKGSLMSLMTD